MPNWEKFSTPDLVIIRDATQGKADVLAERTPSRNPDVNDAFQRTEDALTQQVADIQKVIDSRGEPAAKGRRS